MFPLCFTCGQNTQKRSQIFKEEVPFFVEKRQSSPQKEYLMSTVCRLNNETGFDLKKSIKCLLCVDPYCNSGSLYSRRVFNVYCM